MSGTKPSAGEGQLLSLVVGDVRDLVGPSITLDADLVAAAVRGWSHNTRRAFRADLTVWGSWCRKHRVAPASASGKLVAQWIRALAGIDAADERIRAMATIERYLVHVGWAYRMAGLEDPTAAPLVKLEKKAARKALGTRQAQARAIRYKGDVVDLDAPASGICIATLLKATRRDLLGARDRALLLVAYDTGCRRSELAAITIADIEGPGSDGSGLLTIGRSKTDQTGEGAIAYLSPVTMRAVADWRAAARIERGALFRRVETYFDGSIRGVGDRALNPGTVTLIYKRLVRQAFERKLLGAMSEAEMERWVAAVSSHSIRVGVAQDNFAAGEALPAIMQAYRWRDPKTVLRYGAKLAARSGASARMAARFTSS
jgi:integrase